MIKKYFVDLFQRFKKSSITTKVLIGVFLLFYGFFFAISVIPSNYVIVTPGAINNTIYSVYVDTLNSRGTICTVGVYEYIRPSILQSWIGKAENEMNISQFDPETDLSEEEDTIYGIISKKAGINNAIIVAYEKAQKEGVIINEKPVNLIKNYEGILVRAIEKRAETDLKCDDIITGVEVDGKIEVFSNLQEFKELAFKDCDKKEYVTLQIKKGDTTGIVTCNYLKEINKDGETQYSLPFSPLDYYTVDGANSYPKFQIIDDYSSIGSSGSSLLTLSIYNALLEGDITCVMINDVKTQLRITGTGSIDFNGNIGKIGGVKQKVLTAYLNKADVFFVDEGDYLDAVSALDKYDIPENKLNIIKVKTFDEMVDTLRNYGELYGNK